MLEADFGASRRDVGWLQENLSTVQSCAANVSDKVVKMQSQVTSMERQISATVKVLLSSTQNGRAWKKLKKKKNRMLIINLIVWTQIINPIVCLCRRTYVQHITVYSSTRVVN